VLLLALFIVPLLLLVAVPHELAHLLLARRFGVTVHEFGLGLPPRATSWQWRGVRWSINWLLPLGAFVRLKGEDAGSAHDDFAALPPGKRALVVAAGPVANLAVALVAIVLSGWLVGIPTGLDHGVMSYRPARDPIDAVLSLGGIAAQQNQPLMLSWVGVAQVMEELAGVGIPPLAWFLALLATLSLGLGIANLMPLPPLDGSRILYCGLQKLRGRPVAPQARLNVAGMAALVVLFAIVTGIDLLRLLEGRSILP
jgi:membrane-associated protease RseP (regulator of RpoE activity)